MLNIYLSLISDTYIRMSPFENAVAAYELAQFDGGTKPLLRARLHTLSYHLDLLCDFKHETMIYNRYLMCP